jgi:hypothetical protein
MNDVAAEHVDGVGTIGNVGAAMASNVIPEHAKRWCECGNLRVPNAEVRAEVVAEDDDRGMRAPRELELDAKVAGDDRLSH